VSPDARVGEREITVRETNTKRPTSAGGARELQVLTLLALLVQKYKY
jgi:hypothetical protein